MHADDALGLVTADAISVTESAEVLVARTASGLTIDSSTEEGELRVQLLDDGFDHEVASVEGTSSRVVNDNRSRAAERSSADMRSLSTLRWKVSDLVGAFCRVVGDLAPDGLVSASTESWAIPAPMAPRPTTPIVRISGNLRRAMLSAFPERRARSAHVATSVRYLVDPRVRACEVRERPDKNEECDEEMSNTTPSSRTDDNQHKS